MGARRSRHRCQERSCVFIADPILRGIDKDDPVARNPCLRREPLWLDYWTRLSSQLWRSTRRLVGAKLNQLTIAKAVAKALRTKAPETRFGLAFQAGL
jgi:hypothetical protein